jgi:hypothetical protein
MSLWDRSGTTMTRISSEGQLERERRPQERRWMKIELELENDLFQNN